MSYELKVIDKKEDWEIFAKNHPYTHLFQGWDWGDFKSPEWRPIRVGLAKNNKIAAGAQILSRNFLGKKFFYIPRGPLVDPKLNEVFGKLITSLEDFARREGAFAVCFEPNFDEKQPTLFKNKGFVKARPIQPNDTSIIDLNKPEESLFSDMHPKSRQYIKKAENKAVVFVEDKQSIEEFLKVMDKVRERSRIMLHPNIYYKKFFDVYKKSGNVRLVFVKVGKDIDGGSILVGYGRTFYDLYGGPKGLHPGTKSSHLLKWGSIKLGKKLDFALYDQMGLAPAGNEDHHYAGVTTFKERFGGSRLTYAGTFCLVLNPLWYSLWQAVPAVRDSLIKITKVFN